MSCLPKGFSQIKVPTNGEIIDVFCFKPNSYMDGPLIVVFHGIKRNAEDYVRWCVPMAERFQSIVVAPLLDLERFPRSRFQYGGVLQENVESNEEQSILGEENWTFSIVPQVVKVIRLKEGAAHLPFYLLGHSAGAQFLMRLAALHPCNAQRIVVANPGTCLFPSDAHQYPYGFGGLPHSHSSECALRAYLQTPLSLLIGTEDTVVDDSVNGSPGALKQGRHRLQRNRACFEAAVKMGLEREWPVHWRKVEVAGVGHRATLMLTALEELEKAFFGP